MILRKITIFAGTPPRVISRGGVSATEAKSSCHILHPRLSLPRPSAPRGIGGPEGRSGGPEGAGPSRPLNRFASLGAHPPPQTPRRQVTHWGVPETLNRIRWVA